MEDPVLNITMPVFNRFHTTQRCLATLRKLTLGLPIAITVVDNGSDPKLVDRLIELREHNVINNLLLLPENMGTSIACNIGWELVDAPYYMNLDNDMLLLNASFFFYIFRL